MENTATRKLKQVPEGYLIIGVDPHKKRHAAVAITQDFTNRDKFKFDNIREGLEIMLRRARTEMVKSDCQAIFGGKYSFAILDRNIELIMATGVTVQANFLVSRLSIRSFDDVWAYCLEKGIGKIRVLGLCKQGRAIRNWDRISVSEQEKALFVRHVSELSAKNEISVEFAGLPNHRPCSHSDENGRCLGGISFFHINTNGDIYACPSVKSMVAKRIGSVLQAPLVDWIGSSRPTCSVGTLSPAGFQCGVERMIATSGV